MTSNKYPKPRIVHILQIIHFASFVSAIGVISLLHIITEDFLDILRMPAYVKAIDPWAVSDWPGSFHFYHLISAFFILLTLINALGLFYYSQRSWRVISDFSSFLSFLIIWPISLFFVYTLASTGPLESKTVQSALFFFTVTFFLFILDLVTWYVDDQSLIRYKPFRKRRI